MMAQTEGFIRSINRYSFDLYHEINNENENLFVSPLSTYVALLIAFDGSGTLTKSEFENILHIDANHSLINIKSYLINLMHINHGSNQIHLANGVWIQDHFNINQSYIQNITNKYDATVKRIDFNQKLIALTTINQWVTDQTNGLIKDIVTANDLNEDTRLIISNAIYFISNWADEFDKSLTKSDDFYSISKNPEQIDFMNQKTNLSYYENDVFQFIAIPYEGYDQSFCILLPSNRYGINDIENSMNCNTIESVLNEAKRLPIILTIPKFKLETNYSLIEPLDRMGLKTAFSSKADFQGITSDEPIRINAIKHKTYIEIDEKKTVAAASTIIGIKAGAARQMKVQPKIFKADHPFIFFILDNRTHGILFMGKFVKPTS